MANQRAFLIGPKGSNSKDPIRLVDNGDGTFSIATSTSVVLTPGDIEIGAVEIKNAIDDTRAAVEARGSKGALAVEILDAAGNQIVTFGGGSTAATIADGADVAQGATTGAAVITDVNGTIQQYLRGLVKLIAAKINIKIADGEDSTEGITTGAAVVTDANGTLQGYLRGLVKLIAAKINIATVDTVTAITAITNALPAGTNAIGTVRSSGLSVTVTLTVTNGAYTVADVVGGLITFANAVSANGKHAIVNSVKLAGVVAIPYELWFFNANIATPCADNAVFGLAAGDGAIFLGVVPISAADYNAAQTAFNNATVRGVGLEVKANVATTSIYAYLKATAVTSPATTTLYLTVDFEYVD